VSGEGGSAVIEFIVIGIGILTPILYLVLAAASVQVGVFAATAAAREAGRAFATASTVGEGQARAAAAARLAFANHGLELPPASIRVTCAEGPCLTPGAVITVDIAWQAPLPWLPAGLLGSSAPVIPIEATHRLPIDDYRGDAA
jgi:hypothetical protein